MKSRKKILLSDREFEGSLDQDIDDYEDSRIELQAIGLNLVIFHFLRFLFIHRPLC